VVSTYLTVLGKIDLESLSVILKPQRCHSEENVLAVNRLSLLLLAFLRS
jgi:hypothetical protein